MELIIIIAWLVVTLFIGTTACICGKKYGIEFLVAMFVGSIIVAGAVVNKIIQLGPFTTSAGIVVFSITFLISDTVAEFWGKKQAQRMVWSGFLVYVMFVFVTQISILLPAAEFWQGQEAFETLLGNSWRIALASLLAYVLGQSHDVWAYHFWKKKTGGKHLWLRNNFSTAASQTIDSVVFIGIAFWGVVPIIPFIASTIFLKICIAILDTPFLYLIRWYFTNVDPKWSQEKQSVPTVPGL